MGGTVVFDASPTPLMPLHVQVRTLGPAHPELAASCSYDKTVLLWRLEGPGSCAQCVQRLQGHAAPILQMQCSAGGQLATGACGFCVCVCECVRGGGCLPLDRVIVTS